MARQTKLRSPAITAAACLITNGTTTGPTVSLSNLTISNGQSGVFGGGVYNDHGNLTLTNCTLSQNAAGQGGGISNDSRDGGSATLKLTNCTLSQNSALGGGAIANRGDNGGNATVTLTNCTLSGNTGAFVAGGIHNASGGLGSVVVNMGNT